MHRRESGVELDQHRQRVRPAICLRGEAVLTPGLVVGDVLRAVVVVSLDVRALGNLGIEDADELAQHRQDALVEDLAGLQQRGQFIGLLLHFGRDEVELILVDPGDGGD